MSVKIITQPASEPVTLAEAKLHLRVDTNDEDTLISAFITAAREVCEHRTGRSLMTQTREVVLDDFPEYDSIELQFPPVQSITSVKYISQLGVEVTLNATQYALDNESDFTGHWVTPASGVSFPLTDDVANAVRVRYVAGYADAASVPSGIKSWILLAVGHLYERCNTGGEVNDIPSAFFSSLLDPYRIWSV